MKLSIRETKGLPIECSFAVDRVVKNKGETVGLFPTKEYAEVFKAVLEKEMKAGF